MLSAGTCWPACAVSSAIHEFLPVRSRRCPGANTTWSGCTVPYRIRGVIVPVTVPYEFDTE
jgi:hypothetical protein